MAHKLRIAASVFFGLLALVPAVMWRGSIDRPEFLSQIESSGMSTTFESNRGWAYFYRSKFPYLNEAGKLPRLWYSRGERSNDFRQGVHYICVPYGLMICLAVLASLSPWLYRFSLRTLLIATTLLAVVLGLGVWLARYHHPVR